MGPVARGEDAVKSETLDHTLARYEVAPHLVFWETTKACSLACRHCRASAQTGPAPGELTTAEGHALVDQVAALPGAPATLVFTGGDCLERADLLELVDHAREAGLRLGLAPSVTPRLTDEALDELYAHGVRAVSISLDGDRAAFHDALRGVPGHFEATLDALGRLVARGFRVQVNTTVMASNATQLAGVVRRLVELGVSIWEVFFLIEVGRGTHLEALSADRAEEICHFLADVAALGMVVRTVEAPFYRRVLRERAEHVGEDLLTWVPSLDGLYRELRRGLAGIEPISTRRPATLATGDGRGVVFVAHDGDVLASGFLPVSLGNVRERDLAEIYAAHPTMVALRSGLLAGPCGLCEDRLLCGGSRARAFAASGDPLGSDPACRLAQDYIGITS
jgi:radical SAM protein